MTRLFIALCCAALPWLTGCSSTASSSADPPMPTPSSSSPTPSPREEPETPEEFVRRWVDVSNEMQNSGRTAEYRTLSHGCRPCASVADQVDGYFNAGGYVKTEGWTIKSLNLSPPGDHGARTATVNVESAPTEYKTSAQAPVEHLEGGSIIELMTIEPHNENWVLTDLEQQAQ